MSGGFSTQYENPLKAVRMKSMYESVSRKVRAAQFRADARECERRGYPGFAEINWGMAVLLDPPPREKPVENRRRHRGHNNQVIAPGNTSVNEGVPNGQDRSGNSVRGGNGRVDQVSQRSPAPRATASPRNPPNARMVRNSHDRRPASAR